MYKIERGVTYLSIDAILGIIQQEVREWDGLAAAASASASERRMAQERAMGANSLYSRFQAMKHHPDMAENSGR